MFPVATARGNIQRGICSRGGEEKRFRSSEATSFYVAYEGAARDRAGGGAQEREGSEHHRGEVERRDAGADA